MRSHLAIDRLWVSLTHPKDQTCRKLKPQRCWYRVGKEETSYLVGTKHWLGKVLLLELSSSADTCKFMAALRTVDKIEKFLHITGTNLKTGELQKAIGNRFSDTTHFLVPYPWSMCRFHPEVWEVWGQDAITFDTIYCFPLLNVSENILGTRNWSILEFNPAVPVLDETWARVTFAIRG